MVQSYKKYKINDMLRYNIIEKIKKINKLMIPEISIFVIVINEITIPITGKL